MTPGKTIKLLHKRHGGQMPLKEFARSLDGPQVAQWFENKAGLNNAPRTRTGALHRPKRKTTNHYAGQGYVMPSRKEGGE